MVDAVGGSSLADLKARATSLHREMIAAKRDPASTASAAPAPAPAPAPSAPTSKAQATASATPAYPPGSVELENVQMATGMAKAARTNIETLNIGVSMYNGAAGLLADQGRIEDLRRRGGDKVVDMFMRGHQQIQRAALTLIDGASGKMAQEFTITGTPLSRAEDGAYKVGEYVQSTGGDGWSVSVKSNGQALAIANGVDVSGQVDDSSSSGFKWSSLGRSVDVKA